MLTGTGRIVYVNLGSAQGVRVGDYFRVFRYQGTHIETAYQVQDTAYKAYGFGSTPVAYEWNNLPRQVLGEGIVLRTGPNSSTVMLTSMRRGNLCRRLRGSGIIAARVSFRNPHRRKRI